MPTASYGFGPRLVPFPSGLSDKLPYDLKHALCLILETECLVKIECFMKVKCLESNHDIRPC